MILMVKVIYYNQRKYRYGMQLQEEISLLIPFLKLGTLAYSNIVCHFLDEALYTGSLAIIIKTKNITTDERYLNLQNPVHSHVFYA